MCRAWEAPSAGSPPAVLLCSMATSATQKKRGEEASLEGVWDAPWSEGSTARLGGLLGALFSRGATKQPAPQPCRYCCPHHGGSEGSRGVKDRAIFTVGWCGGSFMVWTLRWQCSSLHPWLLIPASGTKQTTPRGDATACWALHRASLHSKQTQN